MKTGDAASAPDINNGGGGSHHVACWRMAAAWQQHQSSSNNAEKKKKLCAGMAANVAKQAAENCILPIWRGML